MSTIKSDRLDFERLLNGIDPVNDMGASSRRTSPQLVQPQSPVDATTAAEIMDSKVFTFDHDKRKKGIRKRCRKTVMNIVNHVLSKDVISMSYIKDKIEQDIDLLTTLYMQVEINSIMQRTLVDSVSKGQIIPRMFEVFNGITEKILAINKQIIDTEQRIRKTYLDLKFEAREKASDDLAIGFGPVNSDTNNMISGPNQASSGRGVLVTNTTDLINGVKKKHLDSVKSAKFEIKN